MKVEKVHIDAIKPYWRNPRINDKAVDAVKASIKEYGYNQPIVIDPEGIIVVGHTRYKALRQLGYTQLEVVRVNLSKQEAQAYRIADNKTNDLSEWDYDALMFELREIEGLQPLESFFDENELKNLLEIEEVSFKIPEIESKRGEIETVVRGSVIAKAGDKVTNEEIEEEIAKQVQERIEEEYLDYQNKKIDEENRKMETRFAERSAENHEDYIHVECPYCNEEMILSLTELQRKYAREKI